MCLCRAETAGKPDQGGDGDRLSALPRDGGAAALPGFAVGSGPATGPQGQERMGWKSVSS